MAGGSEYTDSRRNFILQQGLDRPAQESCPVRFSAFMFQPRLSGKGSEGITPLPLVP